MTALSLEALFNRLLGPVIKLAYCVYIIFEIKTWSEIADFELIFARSTSA